MIRCDINNNLKDIQNQSDERNISINKVGVKNIKYPIIVLDKNNKEQSTIAKVNMYVNLVDTLRGTHMSRFIEILNEHKGKMTIEQMPEILTKMKERLHSKNAHIKVTFEYFINKKAPVSKKESLMNYRCSFYANSSDDKDTFILKVEVPIMTLCPCSKELSKYNAHNQRSIVSIYVKFREFVWIEELIDIAEKEASSEIYSLLKREDEKYVTEKAYENPKFVEDIVRDIAESLIKNEKITWFKIKSENFESIHNHSAYAEITKK